MIYSLPAGAALHFLEIRHEDIFFYDFAGIADWLARNCPGK